MKEQKPQKCMYCRQRTVVPAVLDEYKIRVHIHGLAAGKQMISVSGLPVLKCEICGDMVLADEANEKITNAIAARKIELAVNTQCDSINTDTFDFPE